MAGFGVEVNLSRNFLHQVGQFSIADNNKVVKNNPGKFLEGYILELSPKAWEPVKSKFLTSKTTCRNFRKATCLKSAKKCSRIWGGKF